MICDIKEEGIDDLISLFEGFKITEQKERAALNSAGEIIRKSMKESAPRGKTGKLSRIRKSIKRVDGALVCTVKTTQFYDVFTEYGTSQSKHKVGWSLRVVNENKDKVIEAIKKKVLG